VSEFPGRIEEELAALQALPVIPAWRRFLSGRRVLVYGVGRNAGGLITAHVLAQHGAVVRFFDHLSQADHPFGGVDRSFPWYPPSRLRAARFWSDFLVPAPGVPEAQLGLWPPSRRVTPEGLFLQAHRGVRIAVTGSKGKSTVVGMVAGMLDWPAVGNTFGHLFSALARFGLAADLVCEWSSFQLQHWRRSALYAPRAVVGHVGAVTNVLSDHLDWHGGQAAYAAAKALLPSHTRRVVARDVGGVWRHDGWHFDGKLRLAGSEFALLGQHNQGNAQLAVALARAAGADTEQIVTAMRKVKPLPHRLQLVAGMPAGITAIDDSQATTPAAAAAAVRALAAHGDGPLHLLLGGVDKGGDRGELARTLQELSQLGPDSRQVIIYAFGASRHSWQRWAVDLGLPVVVEEHLHAALSHLGSSDTVPRTVLLAPACASHDQFADYRARGKAFVELVRGCGQSG
jgi:UDP-N-acetylmuramoylalanine--D-glutamate ligase